MFMDRPQNDPLVESHRAVRKKGGNMYLHGMVDTIHCQVNEEMGIAHCITVTLHVSLIKIMLHR